MPHWIYSDFFRQMTTNVTMVVLNGPTPLTGNRIDEITDTIGVDRIGFFGHSSTDLLILNSPRVQSVVLCDPVVLPQWSFPFRVTSSDVSNTIPFLILRAGQSYATNANGPMPIPDFLGPQLPIETTETITFEEMGHADLLDDTWADLGASAIPWMRGPAAPTRSFREWTFSANEKQISKSRKLYRTQVARRALEHFLPDASSQQFLKRVQHEASDRVSSIDDVKDDVECA